MKIINKFEYWRAQYSAYEGRIVSQKEFAGLLGISPFLLNRYEKHKQEPTHDDYEKYLDKIQLLIPNRSIQLNDMFEIRTP